MLINTKWYSKHDKKADTGDTGLQPRPRRLQVEVLYHVAMKYVGHDVVR
jgi:hypothetical protein